MANTTREHAAQIGANGSIPDAIVPHAGSSNGIDQLSLRLVPERVRREKEPTPAELLEAFNYLDQIWGSMSASFTPAQEADRDRFVHHREETIGKDRLVHSHRFTDPSGKRRSINVGPQVDTLIGIGLTRLKDPDMLSDDAKDKIRDAVETLWWNHSVLSPVNRRQSPVRQGLIQREAREISKDPRISTGTPEGDLALAERRVANWRHINLAPKRIGKPRRFTPSEEQRDVSSNSIAIRIASGELFTSYKNAWQEAERLREERDDKSPSPRFYIPEIKIPEKPITLASQGQASGGTEPDKKPGAPTAPIHGGIIDQIPEAYTPVDWSKADREKADWEQEFKEATKGQRDGAVDSQSEIQKIINEDKTGLKEAVSELYRLADRIVNGTSDEKKAAEDSFWELKSRMLEITGNEDALIEYFEATFNFISLTSGNIDNFTNQELVEADKAAEKFNESTKNIFQLAKDKAEGKGSSPDPVDPADSRNAAKDAQIIGLDSAINELEGKSLSSGDIETILLFLSQATTLRFDSSYADKIDALDPLIGKLGVLLSDLTNADDVRNLLRAKKDLELKRGGDLDEFMEALATYRIAISKIREYTDPTPEPDYKEAEIRTIADSDTTGLRWIVSELESVNSEIDNATTQEERVDAEGRLRELVQKMHETVGNDEAVLEYRDSLLALIAANKGKDLKNLTKEDSQNISLAVDRYLSSIKDIFYLAKENADRKAASPAPTPATGPNPIPVPGPIFYAPPLTFSFGSVDPIWRQQARKNALRQIEEDLKPGQNWKERLKRAPRVAWTRLTEEGRIRDYERDAEAALRYLDNPFAEIDLKNKQYINPDAHREDYRAELLATGAGLEINPYVFANRHSRVDGLFGANLNNKILELSISSITRDEAMINLKAFIKENRREFDKLLGTKSKDHIEELTTSITDRITLLRQQLIEGYITHDQVRNMNILFADTRWGVETKPRLSRKDKAVAWSQSGRFRRAKGVIANPAAIGIATSAGTAVALSASATKAALAPISTAVPILPIAVGSFFGGVYGSIRRHADLGKDRTTFEIDDASGEKTEGKSPRRESIGKFAIDKASAEQLSMDVDFATGLDLSTDPGRQVLVARLGEIMARQKLSERTGADYIRYYSPYQIQREKFALQEAFHRGIQTLISSGMNQQEINNSLKFHEASRIAELTESAKLKDQAFKKHRRTQTALAFGEGAGKGAAAAVGFGAIKAVVGAVGDVANIKVDFGTVARETVDNIHDVVFSSAKAATSIPHPTEEIARQAVFNAPRPSIPSTETITGLPKPTPDVDVQVFAQEEPVKYFEAQLDGKPFQIPSHTRLAVDQINGGYDLVSSRDGTTVLLNDVRWENGKLVADPKSLWADKISTETTTTPDVRKVFGKNGVWKEMSAPIKEVDWDPNGTPGKYDKDELRIFNRRDGNAVVFNIPKSSNGIFLNINGDRVWLPETRDGIVRLDPDSTKLIPGRHDSLTWGDVARIAIDQDQLEKYHGSLQTEVHTHRREIFRVDTIEAGTLKGGKATIHATIQGCGETPKEIRMGETTTSVTKILPGEIPVKPEPTPSPTPEPTPVPTPEPTPSPSPSPSPEVVVPPPPVVATPLNINFDPNPFIAAPFVARKPLEVTQRQTTPTTYPIFSAPITPTPTPHASPLYLSGARRIDRLRVLTDEERGKIIEYADLYLPADVIAKTLNISREQVLEVIYGPRS